MFHFKKLSTSLHTSSFFVSSLLIYILPKIEYFIVNPSFRRMASIANTVVTPPIAVQKPHKVAIGAVPGESRGEAPFRTIRYRDDPWFWLRDDTRKNEEVLEHLRKENTYTEEKTKHLENFQKKLYDEHISHLKETDEDPAGRDHISSLQNRTEQRQPL